MTIDEHIAEGGRVAAAGRYSAVVKAEGSGLTTPSRAFSRCGTARKMALAIMASVFHLGGQPQPSIPKKPAQIALWVVEDVWNKGDFRLAARMFTPGAVLHYRGQTLPLTPESGVQTVRRWRIGFPDFHFEIEDMIVQGNKVALRIPFTGTHGGKFWGLEPTGRKINVTETLILRIEDGKIAEMWEDYDEYGMRIQLGLLKPN